MEVSRLYSSAGGDTHCELHSPHFERLAALLAALVGVMAGDLDVALDQVALREHQHLVATLGQDVDYPVGGPFALLVDVNFNALQKRPTM